MKLLNYNLGNTQKMKKILYIILIISIFVLGKQTKTYAQCNNQLVTICSGNLSSKATYLKELKVRLQAKQPGKKAPIARYALMLSKGTHYRFSVCNAKEFSGKAIIQLYDNNNRLLGSSYNPSNKKHYPAFDFLCNKSSVYKVLVSFEGGKEGCAVGILSMIKDK